MAIEGDFVAEVGEHFEDGMMVHLSISILVDFAKDVFEKFFINFGEDIMLTDIITSQELIDGSFFKFMKAIDDLFSNNPDFVVLFSIHINDVYLIKLDTGCYDIFYLNHFENYFYNVSLV